MQSASRKRSSLVTGGRISPALDSQVSGHLGIKEPRRLASFRWWKVTAERCPRITPEFLAEERVELGDRWFAQEWMCSFQNAVDAVFSSEVIEGARCEGIEALFGTGT